MNKSPQPTFTVNVDVTNPGQYFACCGLLELVDRIQPNSFGWFDASGEFHIAFSGDAITGSDFMRLLSGCELRNTMSEHELECLKGLKSIPKKSQSDQETVQKEKLESLWRESPIVLGKPFNMRIDWFHDSRSGGSRFKTWAGRQSVIDIASAMLEPLLQSAYDEVPTSDWLSHPHGHSLTFNFDSDASSQGAALDVGFSLDPLRMQSSAKPLLELLSFVGLQRFRPVEVKKENQYTYTTWQDPLVANVAAFVTAGVVTTSAADRFSFPLLYRTKYLKSFLPASPIGVNS